MFDPVNHMRTIPARVQLCCYLLLGVVAYLLSVVGCGRLLAGGCRVVLDVGWVVGDYSDVGCCWLVMLCGGAIGYLLRVGCCWPVPVVATLVV